MNRRQFLRTATASAAVLSLSAHRAADTAPEARRDLLDEARERIVRHRTGPGMVFVHDRNGKPVPGARVQVDQLRHRFLFGSNIFMLGRVRGAEAEAEYRRRFAALLNYATLGFYWGAYERAQGHPNYAYTDQVLEWCRDHAIICKGHPLAWDHPASSPAWLPDDFVEIERLSTQRVRDIITRFKGRIDIWDVVNEPTDLTRFENRMNRWAKSLGAVPFTKLHLRVARAANPDATLLVNDYRNDPAFAEILDELRQDGELMFDAIGLQSHMHSGGWPLRRIWDVCDRFQRFGVPLHFTETTVVSGPRLGRGENWGATTPEGEEAQAEYVPDFYTMLFAHPAVEAVTWWDFSDQGAWQRAPAGWLRSDMTPKPVYDRLHSLIQGKWSTTADARTNEDGQAKLRAFFGTHRLTVSFPDGQTRVQEVLWEPNSDNQFTVAAA